MHYNENFFKKYKFLIAIFIIFFIIFIASTFYGVTGIFFDTPSQFFSTTQDLFNGQFKNWYFFADERARHFSTILLSIPYNISLLFSNKDLMTQISWFCASYHIVNFVGLICNYLVATRTKRYDLAVIATFFYCLFIIPNAIWATREVHIASMMQFCLLSYFISKEQLKKLDTFIIILLSIYMFQSFETSILLGIIFFVSSLFYINKNSENKKEKLIIGLFGILCSLYIPIRTYLHSVNSNINFNIGISIQQWTNSIKTIFNYSLQSSLLITYLGLIGTSILIFFKKAIKTKDIHVLISAILIILIILNYATQFIPNPNVELHSYILSILLICPIFICIIVMDYLNIDINFHHKHFYSNLLILSCLIGILNFSWQINSSFHFKNYVDKLKAIIQSSNEPFRNINKKEISDDFSLYANCFGSIHRSIILSPTYKIKTLLFINDDSKRHSYCFDEQDKTYYDKNASSFILQTNYFKIKNKYWDLTELIPEFEKQDKIKKKKPSNPANTVAN